MGLDVAHRGVEQPPLQAGTHVFAVVLGPLRQPALVIGQRLWEHDGAEGRRRLGDEGEGDLAHPRFEVVPQHKYSGVDRSQHLVVNVVEEVLLGHADAEAFEALVLQRLGVVRHRLLAARFVPRVVPGYNLQDDGGVGGAAGHRPGVVKGPAQGGYPAPANAAVCGLEAGNAAERGGGAYGATGVCAQGA